MSDSDTDDSFLLEALEIIEQTQMNSVANTSSESESIKLSITSTAPIKTISSHSNSSQCENLTNNFRANLLKSLKVCETNVVNSKLENKSSPSVKRKIDEKELGHHQEQYEAQVHSQNRYRDTSLPRCSDMLKNKNISDKMLRPKSNFVSNFNSPVNSIVKKRKFPGPAGILPEWGQRGLNLNSSISKTSQFDSDHTENSVCSQSTAQDFISEPWKAMILDLDMLTHSRNLLENHNIRYILRKNALRSQTCIRKISFIALMVRSIDLSHQDATAVFHDETGELQGTISENVLETYGSHISSGTVFILRDATILSPSLFQPGMGVMGQLKKHYLTVTTNSIITIYSPNEDGHVKKIEVMNLTKEWLETLSTDEGFKERTELIENEENEQQQQQLPLYDNIGSGMNNHKGFQKNIKMPEYKSPLNTSKNNSIAAHSGANTKNIPNMIKPLANTFTQINYTTKPNFSKANFDSRNFNMPKSVNYNNPNIPNPNLSSRNPKMLKPTLTSCPSTSITTPTNTKRESLNQVNFSFASNIKKVPPNGLITNDIKHASDAFDTFSDDEELDNLLASINTDAL